MAAVLVHIDLDGDQPHPSSLVALAAGRQVASSWGATLYAAVIAHDPSAPLKADSTGRVVITNKLPALEATQSILARAGADKIVVAMTDTPVAPLWATVGNAWQGVIDHLRPRLVLFGADAPSAPELAPRTGARIGARLLMRARSLGGDEIELRDRDGGYVRVADSGAAVAFVGRAGTVATAVPHDADIDVVVLTLPGGADARVEILAVAAAEVAHTTGVLVALGDDAASDPGLVADARKLATQLDAQLVGSSAAAQVVAAGAIVDKTTPLAPALCVTIGNVQLDLAGSTSLVKIGGGKATKTADGALPGLADAGVRELVKRLEST